MRFPTNQNFLTFIERNFSDFMRKKINFSWVPKVLRAEGTPITSIKYPQLLSQGLFTEQCNACGSHSILLETRQVGRTSNLHNFMFHSQTLLSLRLPIIQNSTVWTSKLLGSQSPALEPTNGCKHNGERLHKKYLRSFRCSTKPTACFAEHFANQLSPSKTVTSLVWTSLPGMKARGPNGTYWSKKKEKGKNFKHTF